MWIRLFFDGFNLKDFKVQYNGGGHFVNENYSSDDVDILAWYPSSVPDVLNPGEEIKDLAVIVGCHVKSGIAVLIFVHPEYSLDSLRFDLAKEVVPTDYYRKAFFWCSSSRVFRVDVKY